jgi:hypothetical protein
MKPQRVINKEELDKLSKYIDEIKSRATISSCSCQTMPVIDKMELDDKLKKVLDYINNNPNITKQNVVDAFKNEVGFSRRVVFKIFKELEESNLVSVKVDSVTKRHHHLFADRVNVSALLITLLEYFKKLYFELIYRTKPFIERKISAAGITPTELVRCLVMLYKFTKDRFFDFFVFYGKICDPETLHRKFGIIRKDMYKIPTEFYQILLGTVKKWRGL